MANITINDIIRAIDIIICREDLFTDEDIAQAFDQNTNYFSKAAQAVMGLGIDRSVTSLLNKGWNPSQISNKLNININNVNSIIKKFKNKLPESSSNQDVWGITDLFDKGYDATAIRKQFPHISNEQLNNILDRERGNKKTRLQNRVDKLEAPVLNTLNRETEALEMVNLNTIGKELNINPKFVKMILNSNGITDLKKLEKERSQKVMTIVADIYNILETQQIKITVKIIQQKFYQKTHMQISENSVTRALAYQNKKTDQSKMSPNVKAVYYWIYARTHGKIEDYIKKQIRGQEVNPENTHQIFNSIAFKIIQLYGKDRGYKTTPPIDIEEFKRILKGSYDIATQATQRFFDNKNKQQPSQQLRANSNNWYKIAKEYDKLPGGRGQGKQPTDFPKDQIDKGREIEQEHGPDKDQATEIALDHLTEFDDYYTGLDQMEEKLKEKHKK
jgi:hypothetical protein